MAGKDGFSLTIPLAHFAQVGPNTLGIYQPKKEIPKMTVAELIAILQTRPQDAPAYVWDGDCAQFSPVECVSNPAGPAQSNNGLPEGAIVVWGS